MKSIQLLLVINTLILISFVSCSKDTQEQDVAIPYVPISERININDPLYVNLHNVGGWVYLNEGSRGLILYRESVEEVKAFERHCTYDPSEVCSTVDMDAGLLQANDNDCCGSVFGISNRSVIKGPASRPLLEYETQFDGTYVIITN